LTEHAIKFETATDSIEDTLFISIEEPEDSNLWDLIDERFDALNELDQAEIEQGMDGMSGAGIYIELSTGENTLATVNPDVMNRMLSVISMDEFNAFVETIVHSVEKPDDSSICQQLEKADSE
ncbi:MAG TPA: hypothetical protein DD827_03015, partial [Gammaproteobacteria bacterium]|nr:hypothetical protein [Gammaproteobacteria bacterium]